MARIKVELPHAFPFTTRIPVRITDLNYGGHVGNDTILSLIHESRMQFLSHLGYTEMKFAGVGMIMSAVIIEYKHELFYPDIVHASVAAGDISKYTFDLYYKFELTRNPGSPPIFAAAARTAMTSYDYANKKIASIPSEAVSQLKQA